MSQQQFEVLQKLLETLSANLWSGIVIIGIIMAYTQFKRQQTENKRADITDQLNRRILDIEKISYDREQSARSELQRQRDINEKQRAIIDEQSKISQEALKALENHNRLIAEGNKMAEELNKGLSEDITQVKVNLADGVSIAEENNTLTKESIVLARDTSEAVKRIDEKIDALPTTTAQAVTHVLEPIQDEFETVSEKLQGLTNVVKEQPDLAGKVDTLILQMTEVQQTLKEIREAVKPPKNETPTLPSKPEDLKP